MLKLLSNGAVFAGSQGIKANTPFWLLERLNQPIQQNAVETTIMPMDAVLVVLVEGVQGRLPSCSASNGIVAVISDTRP